MLTSPLFQLPSNKILPLLLLAAHACIACKHKNMNLNQILLTTLHQQWECLTWSVPPCWTSEQQKASLCTFRDLAGKSMIEASPRSYSSNDLCHRMLAKSSHIRMATEERHLSLWQARCLLFISKIPYNHACCELEMTVYCYYWPQHDRRKLHYSRIGSHHFLASWLSGRWAFKEV